ncbi:MAG: hypothetical protein LBH96_05390 [Candidatus Peribacteria bacterium]|jgi:hypothetical protein|nr:hypothetical protein [Candidatus Peribacteria bacterium]
MDYESEQDSSIKDQILDVFAFGDVPYFFNRRETHFKSDENGNYRIILPTINEEERTGF